MQIDTTIIAVRRLWVRRPEVRLVAFGLVWRLFSTASAFLVNVIFPQAQQQFSTELPHRQFWDALVRYDGGWYFGVARYGYEFVEGGRSNLAFMPVYPMLMRYLGLAFGGGRENIYLAGLVISWLSYLLAIVMVYRLARLFVPRAGAERAAILASVFPFAFFFGVVYTEALFLLLSVTAFYGFSTRRWWLGGLAGALAGATRVNGILLLPALALLAWKYSERHLGARVRAACGLAVVPLGLAAYSVYAYTKSGSFIEWAHSITRWNYSPGGMPWSSIYRVFSSLLSDPYGFLVTDRMAPFDLLNASAALVFVLAIPFVWRRLGAAYAVLMIAGLWLPLSSGSLEGLGRYCAVLFPFFILLGSIRSRTAYQWTLAGFGALYMLCMTLFTKVYPIL
ncbi:MAG: mannosyltransferase family protein [Vicinamibacterales bacterium]|nr:mannosyltransferase family protein [Vicinamibacterales bacterium]